MKKLFNYLNTSEGYERLTLIIIRKHGIMIALYALTVAWILGRLINFEHDWHLALGLFAFLAASLAISSLLFYYSQPLARWARRRHEKKLTLSQS